jgi:hypothetical protein
MDARLLALAAGVALAAWLFISLQRDLAQAGAGIGARVLAGVMYALMGLSWGAVLLSLAPLWIAWIATAGAFAVTLAPRALLRVRALPRVPPLRVPGLTFSRASSQRQRLAAEIGSIRMGLSTLTTSSHERELLRAKVRRLERWRGSADPIARELVELVEEAVGERLDVGPGAFDRARERRIRELLTRLRG